MAEPSREQRIIAALAEREDRLAKGIAESWGAPPFSEQITRDEELDLWDARSDTATAEQLTLAGAPEDMVRQMVTQFGDAIPVNEAVLFGLGLKPSQVARLVFQERYAMLTMGGRATIDDQVKWAEKMAKASAERAAKAAGMGDDNGTGLYAD